MIRNCSVLAIDGTHNAGKSTLAAALVDYYAAGGVDVIHVDDQARSSGLITAIVTDPDGTFDLVAELHLLASTIARQIDAAAGHQLLVTDKTVANVLAYARLLMAGPGHEVITAAAALCAAWQPYDLVVRCRDHYPIDLDADPFRNKVHALQAAADLAVASALADASYPVAELPTGLTTDSRLAWVTAQPALAHLNCQFQPDH
ncbi:AAA family ATPase [Nostocoides australiense]